MASSDDRRWRDVPPAYDLDRERGPVLSDPVADDHLRRFGFARLTGSLFDDAAIDRIRRHFDTSFPSARTGFHNDFFLPDPAFRREASAVLDAEGAAECRRRLPGFTPFLRTYLAKFPGDESELAEHRDWMYVDEIGGERSYIVYVAIDDATDESGMVHVVPRSHLLEGPPCGTGAAWPWLRHHDILRRHAVPLPLARGEIAVWDNRLIHFSLRNSTAATRLAVGFWCHRVGGALAHFARRGSGYVRHDVDEAFFLSETPAQLADRPTDAPAVDRFDVEAAPVDEETLQTTLEGTGAPNRPWRIRSSELMIEPASAEAAQRPRARADVGQRRLDDGSVMIAAHLTGQVRVLAPIEAVLWASLDGDVTIAELSEDLVDAIGGSLEARSEEVRLLVDGLRRSGFVDTPPAGTPLWRARHVPDPASCLGSQIGLGRMDVRGVAFGSQVIGIASNDPVIVGSVEARFGAVPVELGDVSELFAARCSVGRVPRVQQIFDTLGNVIYSSRDLALCREAVLRTVAGRIESETGVWAAGISLRCERGIILLHPWIGSAVVTSLRPALERLGFEVTPSGMVELLPAQRVRLPTDLRDGQDETAAIVGIVTAVNDDAHAVARSIPHLGMRMDDEHLSRLGDLTRSVGVAAVPFSADPGSIVPAIARLASR